MAPLYKTYITRHPTALAQFQSLPPSPALTAYMNTTRTLTASHTHAWDIPSLLIKPVQRLLKYPLLLSTIYSDTPDTHPDKATLLEAKESVEEVARMVNEGRRRWEVVKTVLGQTQAKKEASNPSTPPVGGPKGSPAPKMSRMRSFRSKIKAGIVDVGDLNQGKEELERWEKRIKECEMVTKDVARRECISEMIAQPHLTQALDSRRVGVESGCAYILEEAEGVEHRFRRCCRPRRAGSRSRRCLRKSCVWPSHALERTCESIVS